MSAPIDSSLCRLTPSLKKKLLCGYSLDNVCPIYWGLHHEPVAVIVLGILQVCLKLCSDNDFPLMYRAFIKYIIEQFFMKWHEEKWQKGSLCIAFKSFQKDQLLVMMMTVTMMIYVMSNFLAHELGQEIMRLTKMNISHNWANSLSTSKLVHYLLTNCF